MSARPCKKCGMPIEFIEGPNGKAIPAQRLRTIYEIADLNGIDTLLEIAYEPKRSFYVSHFETCPAAREFSRKKTQ